ncbi:hypothetical protein ACHAWX_005139 [Stephanocyclus meneghinianus]
MELTTPPFHVLLLPGGNTSCESRSQPGDACPATRVDYLSRRHEFWRKKASNCTVENSASTEYRVSVDTLKNEDEDQVLQSMATPLELALVECCERVASDHRQTATHKPIHRSRLHRPICPSNYDDDIDSSKDEDHCDDEESKPKRFVSQKLGVLRRGKECHFLSLVCMYCTSHALGHRALALAILQRTVDWESMCCSSNGQGEASSTRMKIFLKAGGMKLLARWLVDSFTLVPSQHSHVASPTGSLILPILQLLKSIPFNKDIVVESHIHKIIKRLKKAIDALVDGLDPSHLKEKHPITGGLHVGIVLCALDELMSTWKEAAVTQVEPNAIKKGDTDDESEHSPFDRLRKELESRFENLVALQNEGGVPPPWLPKSISSIISGKSNLLAMYARSFKQVVSVETNGIDTPSETQKQPSPNTQSEVQKQQSPKLTHLMQQHVNDNSGTSKSSTVKDIGTWEKFMSRKRKEREASSWKTSPTQTQKMNHTESSKRVTWVDRPQVRSAVPAPLADIRFYEKDVIDESDDTSQQNSALYNEKDELSPFIALQDEAGDDSEMEDLFVDPDMF